MTLACWARMAAVAPAPALPPEIRVQGYLRLLRVEGLARLLRLVVLVHVSHLSPVPLEMLVRLRPHVERLVRCGSSPPAPLLACRCLLILHLRSTRCSNPPCPTAQTLLQHLVSAARHVQPAPPGYSPWGPTRWYLHQRLLARVDLVLVHRPPEQQSGHPHVHALIWPVRSIACSLHFSSITCLCRSSVFSREPASTCAAFFPADFKTLGLVTLVQHIPDL